MPPTKTPRHTLLTSSTREQSDQRNYTIDTQPTEQTTQKKRKQDKKTCNSNKTIKTASFIRPKLTTQPSTRVFTTSVHTTWQLKTYNYSTKDSRLHPHQPSPNKHATFSCYTTLTDTQNHWKHNSQSHKNHKLTYKAIQKQHQLPQFIDH